MHDQKIAIGLEGEEPTCATCELHGQVRSLKQQGPRSRCLSERGWLLGGEGGGSGRIRTRDITRVMREHDYKPWRLLGIWRDRHAPIGTIDKYLAYLNLSLCDLGS